MQKSHCGSDQDQDGGKWVEIGAVRLEVARHHSYAQGWQVHTVSGTHCARQTLSQVNTISIYILVTNVVLGPDMLKKAWNTEKITGR
jgi:hypothetical protein